MGCIVKNRKEGALVDLDDYDGPGVVPQLREYVKRASAINVVKLSLVLKTRPNYLEVLAKILPGTRARTSVNSHVGKCLGKVLEMTEQRYVPIEEVGRLVERQREHGVDAVHIDLCRFYSRREGCRYAEDCSQWHAELGAQSRADDDDWDRD